MIEQLLQASVDPPLMSLKPRQQYRKRADDEVEEAVWYEPGTEDLARPRKQIRLQSLSSVDEAIVNFENVTSSKVRVLWLDFKGNEVAYSIIPPKTSKRYKTYVSHPWIAREVVSGQRMVLGERQVVYAFAGEHTVKIDWPPRVQWQPSAIKVYPEEFKSAVNGLLLAHHHLQRFPEDIELPSRKHQMLCPRGLRHLNFLRFCKGQQGTEHTHTPSHSRSSSIDAQQADAIMSCSLGAIPSDLVMDVINTLAAQYTPLVFQDISLPAEFRPEVLPALLPLPPPEAMELSSGVAA